MSAAHLLDPPAVEEATWANLTAGDVVRVRVAGHPELSSAAEGERVDPDGFVYLPHIGSIRIDGMSVSGARDVVRSHAERFVRDPSVTITVLDYGARDVYVVGHIDQPGAYRIDRSLTAVQALALAGKLLPGAARTSIYLMRPGPEGFAVLPFDLTRPSADWMVQVQPDDVIFVPRGRSGVFSEEVLPYLQGLGHLASVPVAFRAFE